MRRDKVYYEAYFTVEASVIMPAAVMILLLVIYWGFFCYDKSVSLQCSYIAALRASNEWELSKDESEKIALETLEKLTSETILYSKNIQIYADAGVASIEAGVSGKLPTLFLGLGGIETDDWKLESVKSAYRLKPTFYIRKYHMIGNAMK